MNGAAALVLALLAASPTTDVVEQYLDRYFETYPSRATAAGRHDLDDRLEDLDEASRAAWLTYNRQVAQYLRQRRPTSDLSSDERLDAELLLRHTDREVFAYGTLRRPEHDPLFWTGIAADATVWLLVRDDLPEAERLAHAATRAALLPRLTLQARRALGRTSPSEIAPELCRLAAGQASASARFYREGFASAAAGASPELRRRMAEAGQSAAAALDELASFLEMLGETATGSPRLAGHYGAAFFLTTGVRDVDRILRETEASLRAKVTEAAAFGRGIWPQVFPGTPAPAGDRGVLRRLFERIGDDGYPRQEAFGEHFRTLTDEALAFIRKNGLLTVPDTLRVDIRNSPDYFVGQSVGGLYPAGPYTADAASLLFLPSPPPGASPDAQRAFFRDFNRHFTVMIVPHEVIPGHALQLAVAAGLGHPVRALFPDDVYVEGWGTFSERLMLDLGWGTPLARIAHYKKQLENLARTLVDIRVHTTGMTREDVLAFVQDVAMQDEQFAANMWTRSIVGPTQLVTYHLGYRALWDLYQDLRQVQGDDFDLRRFLDGMMAEGPVPIAYYRQQMLPGSVEGPRAVLFDRGR